MCQSACRVWSLKEARAGQRCHGRVWVAGWWTPWGLYVSPEPDWSCRHCTWPRSYILHVIWVMVNRALDAILQIQYIRDEYGYYRWESEGSRRWYWLLYIYIYIPVPSSRCVPYDSCICPEYHSPCLTHIMYICKIIRFILGRFTADASNRHGFKMYN